MKVIAILSLGAALALAGPAFAATGFTPGQWEIATKLITMEMPGMPEGVVKNMIGKTTVIRHCLTAADAAADPQALMKKSAPGCSYSSFRMTGGTVDATLACKQQGGTMNGHVTGRYTPTSYAMASQMSMSSGMKMTSAATGKLVGPCK